jgi:hypothetical protein
MSREQVQRWSAETDRVLRRAGRSRDVRWRPRHGRRSCASVDPSFDLLTAEWDMGSIALLAPTPDDAMQRLTRRVRSA